jgi:hypothetical protein
MRELKPCPFCSSDQSEIEVVSENIAGDTYEENDPRRDDLTWYAICIVCGAEGPKVHGEESDDPSALAAEQWNLRPGEYGTVT